MLQSAFVCEELLSFYFSTRALEFISKKKKQNHIKKYVGKSGSFCKKATAQQNEEKEMK